MCTLIYVLLTPITTLSSDWVYDFYPEAMPIATLVFTLTATILLLMFSPMSYQHLFSALWISSLYKPDMELLQEKVETADRFGKYELTPRQKEVATLLLAAKTRRQIAGELGLSESTVKMHVSELYKRLDINSRAELFKKFGVSEEYEKTS
jgi:DNA-binding CsgD family transcriptional regulator